MLKIQDLKTVDLQDWNELVTKTYGRPYSLQQQDGCMPRGTLRLEIPSDYTEDDEMNDEIPERVNDQKRGVKFEKWLERDPNQPIEGETGWRLGMWWNRNFYPDLQTVANDLHKKGLVEAGVYLIIIDW
jgi:hypothetical protein